MHISFLKSKFTFVFSLFILSVGQCIGQIQAFNYTELQSDLKQTIQKVYGASISIAEYDSISKKKTSGSFSGVVVSADGYILTAAHASAPLKNYLVTFPDGKRCTAVGLGEIASLDAAVMKINQNGIWPFADMGFSSTLKVNQPCISISYPGSLRGCIIIKKMIILFFYAY